MSSLSWQFEAAHFSAAHFVIASKALKGTWGDWISQISCECQQVHEELKKGDGEWACKVLGHILRLLSLSSSSAFKCVMLKGVHTII